MARKRKKKLDLSAILWEDPWETWVLALRDDRPEPELTIDEIRSESSSWQARAAKAVTPSEIKRRGKRLRRRMDVAPVPPAVRVVEMRDDALVCPSVGPGYTVRLAFSYAITRRELEGVLQRGFHGFQAARPVRVDPEQMGEKGPR
jgi:hypothetical protein